SALTIPHQSSTKWPLLTSSPSWPPPSAPCWSLPRQGRGRTAIAHAGWKATAATPSARRGRGVTAPSSAQPKGRAARAGAPSSVSPTRRPLARPTLAQLPCLIMEPGALLCLLYMDCLVLFHPVHNKCRDFELKWN
uniref:Uncharacterized protein n=1 Tax=Triticum urartu TaxID=4572 RepID=A0A8R7UY66_TRIUA